MSDSFTQRSRQHVGKLFADYGDKITALMRMIEADTGIVDADRECFDKDEGLRQFHLVGCMRLAAMDCYVLAHDLAGIDTRRQLMAIDPSPETQPPTTSDEPF